jgi:hypothetical protein
MILTLELSAEEEARLLAQARRQGQNMEDRAHDLVRAGLGVAPTEEVTEEQHAILIHRLRDAGLLTELPTHPGQTTPFQPITVLGPPVSQTLVEDRE